MRDNRVGLNMLTIEVMTSGIWQLSSVVLSDGGEVLVVDPGYFPRELEALRQVAAERGRTRAVVFTHGHWDHVIGWRTFPGAAVHASPTLATAVAADGELARQNLDRARMFDGQWYVDRELAWPETVAPVREGERLEVGRSGVQALLLPGHSPDGLVLVADGVLLAGDYLSPCEIPFVDDLHAYRATLGRLIDLTKDLAGVIPDMAVDFGRTRRGRSRAPISSTSTRWRARRRRAGAPRMWRSCARPPCRG